MLWEDVKVMDVMDARCEILCYVYERLAYNLQDCNPVMLVPTRSSLFGDPPSPFNYTPIPVFDYP